MITFRNLLAVMFLLGCFLEANGQEEPRVSSKATVNMGVLIQAVGDFQNVRNQHGVNGFSLGNARLIVHGILPGKFAYRLQLNAAGSSPLQEARISYWFIRNRLRAYGGVFKAPFSKELLTAADAIDFVNRSNVVSALAPGFQTGVMLEFWPVQEEVQLQLGAFNGNPTAQNGNDNNAGLYVGRIGWIPLHEDEERFEAGINYAFSDDNSAVVDGLSRFNGERELFGFDMRYTTEQVLIAAEIVRGSLRQDNGFSALPMGYHVTGGYMLDAQNQLLLRYDSYDNDRGTESNWVVLGYNLWPTTVTEFQANYIVDLDEAELKHHRILLNVQVSF